MHTEYLTVDSLSPDRDAIGRAAELLRCGHLVAFPTETVYGLGANALDAAAVTAIYAAKGRPASNPVIVHVASLDAVADLVANWPESAAILAARFWPGPLTLVVPKAECVPSVVTANGPKVAIRIPSHPVALAILREANVPIAAPSANRSNEVSPTTAKHVLQGLAGRIPLVVDGGACSGGIESTVLDVTTNPPTVLRPGLLSIDDLQMVLGPIRVSQTVPADALPSPGMLPRHYSPRTPTICVEEQFNSPIDPSEKVVLLTFGPPRVVPAVEVMALPNDPVAAAARLYATLHVIDEADADRLIVELPVNRPEWMAIRDRLLRASHEH